eukprot:10306800-Lingulodinium_polyedra.AAC.1
MSGWADLFQHAWPACQPSNGMPSRVDRACVNLRPRAWIQTAVVRWDLGLATRVALRLNLVFEHREPAWVRT